MRQVISSPLLFISVVLGILDASPTKGDTLPIPKSGAANKVIVSASEAVPKERVIDDAKRIERLITFLKARNDGWLSLKARAQCASMKKL